MILLDVQPVPQQQFDSDYFQFLALLATSITTLVGTGLTIWAGIINRKQEKAVQNVESIAQERERLEKAAHIYRNALTLIRGNLSTISYYQGDDSKEIKILRTIDETIHQALLKGDQFID
ncbi:MAG: hypothetical protein ACRC8A_13325 [Microcoleaceae cyanobacterium]